LVWDAYLYFWRFYRGVASCRGAFPNFASAKAMAPRGALVGYNQPSLSTATSVSVLTARRGPEQFDPLDYPVFFWLRQVTGHASRVFNLGGNVGTEYYAYRNKAGMPEEVQWCICEIPEVARAGEILASQKGVRNLTFTTRFDDASGYDILLTCGTLQYIEEDLSQLLRRLGQRPKHVLVNRVAMYDGRPFVTLQNLGYAFTPYCVRNVEEFVSRMEALGYRLVDAWRDSRINDIPFRPALTVRGYRGFYFTTEPHLRPETW
jgi:putative methyltransferase (TIGR04325 family)